MGVVSIVTAHGAGAGAAGRVEVTAKDLQRGVQAPEHVEASGERRANGTINKGAQEIPRRGGKALKHRTALANGLDLAPLLTCPAFAPFLSAAPHWQRKECARLRERVGGGELGPGPELVVRIASLQAAASLYYFARGDFDQATRFGNDSAQSLLKAAALAAQAAPRGPGKRKKPWTGGT